MEQKGKQMKALLQTTKVETVETEALLRGGFLNPVGSFRFSPFPRGETMKRSRCCCEECRGFEAEAV